MSPSRSTAAPHPPAEPAQRPVTVPRTTAGRAVAGGAVVVGLALLVWQLSEIFFFVRDDYLLDVGVFRDAGRAVVEGGGLYGEDFDSRSGFAFIYPPFAAALFVPLTWFDEMTMEALWTVASLVAAWAVLAMAAHRLRLPWAPVLALPMLGVALMFEPVQSHMMFGQINVFLILLVTADLLGYTPKWLRGAGVGVAAGIKITPAAFALWFLVSRQWGDLARSVGAFFITVALGWAMRAEESLFYWTDEFFNGDRGGAPDFDANQAITGLLTRAGMDNDLAQVIMIPGLLLIAAATAWGLVRLLRGGQPVTALLLIILAVCISAPVAVTHHWTGIIVAVALLVALVVGRAGERRDRWALVAVSVLVVPNILVQGMDHDAPLYRVFEDSWVLGNIQGIAGVVCFVLLLVVAGRIRATTTPEVQAHSM